MEPADRQDIRETGETRQVVLTAIPPSDMLKSMLVLLFRERTSKPWWWRPRRPTSAER